MEKKKKVLMLATTAAMSAQFNRNNILILEEMGYEVHVAGNFRKGNPISDEAVREFYHWTKDHGGRCFQIPSTRKVYDIINNFVALKKVIKLIREEKYEFIHCHTPIGSVIGRLAGRKTGTRVLYTAHGLHFFKGAPLINWILYYPVEKFLSRYTDVMILINHEDYNRVLKKFRAKKVVYVPGIGIDTEEFKKHRSNRQKMRESLGLSDKDFMLLSVGELSGRKNHEVIVKAVNELGRPDVKYFIAGKGKGKDNEEEHLKKLIEKLGLEDRVSLLGFREDAPDLYAAADAVAFPSNREGLGLAGIEAMAAGLPILTSNINGINDYSINGETGFSYRPNDVSGFAEGIAYLADNPEWSRKVGEENIRRAADYDYHIANEIMRGVYSEVDGEQ